MPSFPSRSTVSSAAARSDRARAAQNPGEVIIANRRFSGEDVSVVKGSTPPLQMEDGGPPPQQTLIVTIAKTTLRIPHASGLLVTYQQEGWKIDSISGHRATDTSWRYICLRAPGADTAS